jgi:hypothetical protein
MLSEAMENTLKICSSPEGAGSSPAVRTNCID